MHRMPEQRDRLFGSQFKTTNSQKKFFNELTVKLRKSAYAKTSSPCLGIRNYSRPIFTFSRQVKTLYFLFSLPLFSKQAFKDEGRTTVVLIASSAILLMLGRALAPIFLHPLQDGGKNP